MPRGAAMPRLPLLAFDVILCSVLTGTISFELCSQFLAASLVERSMTSIKIVCTNIPYVCNFKK